MNFMVGLLSWILYIELLCDAVFLSFSVGKFGSKIWSHLSSFNFLVNKSDAKIGRTSSFSYHVSSFSEKVAAAEIHFRKDGWAQTRRQLRTLKSKELQSNVESTKGQKGKACNFHWIFLTLCETVWNASFCILTSIRTVCVTHLYLLFMERKRGKIRKEQKLVMGRTMFEVRWPFARSQK